MKVLVEDVLVPQLLGEDPTRVEFLWEKIYSASRLPLAHGRPYHRAGSRGETIHAISGIDVALWDIYGKSLGVPIYRLLGGGERERMPAYASGGWAPPERTADEVLGYRAKGFKGAKIRVGGVDEPHFPQRSLEHLRLAREALGPDFKQMMDAHGALTVERAIWPGEGACEYEVTWFEEPVLADDDLPGGAEVRRRVPMPWRPARARPYASLQGHRRATCRGLPAAGRRRGWRTDRSTPGSGPSARAWAASRTARVEIGTVVGSQFAVGAATPTASSSSSVRPTTRCCTTC
jgi:hypothetical protein